MTSRPTSQSDGNTLLVGENDRVFLYTMTHDTNLAPHISRGIMTLALCKWKIREHAEPGDWVIGKSGASMSDVDPNAVLYVMKIEERITFDEYFGCPSLSKRIDNIYRHSGKSYIQDKRRKRFKGHESDKDIRRDLSCNYVLLSRLFAYFGDRWKQDYSLMIPLDAPPEMQNPIRNYKTSFENRSILVQLINDLVKGYGVGTHGTPNGKLELLKDSSC